jgi:hypothetical protein
VIIGFGTAAQFPNLGGSVIGYAGPYYSSSYSEVRFSGEEYVTGRAVFDVGDPGQPSQGFGAGNAFGKVALHELGHLIGLGHVDNTDEIMNPVLIQRAGMFGAGDTVGLRVLYQTQDCAGSSGSFLTGLGDREIPDFGNRESGIIELP